MKFRPITFLLVLTLLATSAAASDPSPAPSRREAGLVNVDFRGGTIADLVAAINSSGQNYFNVIGESADLAAPLPPFALRNADAYALAGALKELVKHRGLTIESNGGNPTSAVFVLTKLRTTRSEPPLTFHSVQLAPYLHDQTIEDITSAIRTAWELDPENDPKSMQLKFHPPTSILLVSGSGKAINVVMTIIAALKKPQPSPTPPVAEKK
jgi:hypothetical protein